MSTTTTPRVSSARADILLVLVASMAFATSGPLGKITAPLPPITVACTRTAIAAAVLALAQPRSLVRALVALTPKQRLGVLLAGTLLGGHFALFLGGLGSTSLAAAVALISLEPVAVVAFAFVAFRLRPTRREMFGLLVATAGAFVVASGAGAGEHRLLGDVMVLGAVALFGAYVAAARGLRDAMPPNAYAAAVYGTSSIVLAPFSLWLINQPEFCACQVLPRSYIAMVALGLVPTLIGHTLVQRAARHAPPVLVALVCPGETVLSIAIGIALMHTLPSKNEAIGTVVVIAGAVLSITGGRAQKAGAAEPGLPA